jgi:hypothetical protein
MISVPFLHLGPGGLMASSGLNLRLHRAGSENRLASDSHFGICTEEPKVTAIGFDSDVVRNFGGIWFSIFCFLDRLKH